MVYHILFFFLYFYWEVFAFYLPHTLLPSHLRSRLYPNRIPPFLLPKLKLTPSLAGVETCSDQFLIGREGGREEGREGWVSG